jgi:hypothetical protein
MILAIMKVVGIEFAANDMNYVVLKRDHDGKLEVSAANRLSLLDTRSCEELRSFQQAIQTLLKDTSPAIVAIKHKPEKGTMKAGAAALKMEGLVLANSVCDTQFISGARINKCEATDPSLKAYHHPAFKAAACAANAK